ncbi:cytochrome ubiquinol oxidase subunit I, partial [Cobetia marina]
LASLILTHDPDGVVPGLKEVAPDKQPPVWFVFWSFRVMVAMGLLMIAVAFIGVFLRRDGKLYRSRPFLQTLRLMSIAPFFAVLAGWFVTEAGRSPWLVYEMMTQQEAITPSLTGWMVLTTLIGYFLVYLVVFVTGSYYLTRVIRGGMQPELPHDDVETAMRPLSAAHESLDDDASRTVRS